MNDLSKWVMRNGGEIVFGPVEQPGGNWLYICRERGGAYFTTIVNSDGASNVRRTSEYDLIPPVRYVYRTGAGGLVLTTASDATHRYTPGDGDIVLVARENWDQQGKEV